MNNEILEPKNKKPLRSFIRRHARIVVDIASITGMLGGGFVAIEGADAKNLLIAIGGMVVSLVSAATFAGPPDGGNGGNTIHPVS